MNFEQLNIITTLSEEKSFSKTANKLSLTTSAVSQGVKSLENELGIELFKRSRNGTFPTTQGQYIINKSRFILDKKREIYNYAENKNNFPKLKLRIGSIPGINYPLIKAIQDLEREFPFVELSISEGNTDEILHKLKEEKCDFALLAFTDNLKNHNINYNYKNITEGKFYCSVNNKSNLSKKEIITYKDLKDERIAIYDDKFLLNFISHAEDKIDSDIRILFKTNNFISIMNSVNENIAISFGPSFAIVNDFYDKLDNIKIIPFEEDKEVISPSLWFLWSKNKSLEEIGLELFSSIKRNIRLI